MSERKDYELNAEPRVYRIKGAPMGASVDYALNGLRLAVLSLVLSFAATLGAEFGGSWGATLAWTGVVAVVTLAVLALSRRQVAALMRLVLGA